MLYLGSMKKILIGLVVIVGLLVYVGYAFTIDAPETPSDTASQGKLDINAVCTSALAYMTFPDGASADAFVAECKEGKHPDVIDRYKAEMNLGAGAEI